MIRIYCDKAHAVLKETEILTAGMLNYPEVQLTYSDDLAGYGKAAIVRAGTVERTVTVVDDAFHVPYECLANSGVNLIIGIRFVGATPVIPSIWCDCGMIYDGADPDAGSTGEATQTLVDQMIEYAALVAEEAEDMDEAIIRNFLLSATNVNQYGTATATITDTGPGANRTITLTLANLKGNGIEAVAWTTTGENKGRLQIRTSDNVVTDFDGFVDALAYIEGIQNTSAIDAAEAATAASNAEAWAVGQRDGTDVPDTDDTYHNNSKYYAEQASDAADVAEYYAGKAEAASGYTIDDELDPTSMNLVMNMAVANAVNALDQELDTKQNAEQGKGLSTQDFTTEYKDKLDGIVDGANVANLSYDTTNKKLTKTINGTTADVVTAAALKSDMAIGSGDVGYNSSTTYSSGTVGKAVSDLNGAIKTVFNGKKALIIGDSYNKNNPYGWGYYFKTVTGMGNNVISIQQNGGGFGRVAQTGSDYPNEYYYQAIAHISTSIDFDYIIAQAGRNDAYSPEDTTGAILINGINQFVSVCKTRWANAKIFIFPTNNDSPLDDAHYKFMRLIPETALKNGVVTSFQSFKWFYDTNLNHSDGAHLVSAGYELLAQYIASYIAGWNGILPEQKYDHKNLLKNSVFSRFIINSRGITNLTTTATQQKFIDGWRTGRSVITVNANSISLAWNGNDGTNGYITQHKIAISLHSHFTMSAVIDGELYYKPFVLKDDQTVYNYYPITTLLMRVELSGSLAVLTIYNYSTTAVEISGVKFEYGNEQTLATKYEGNLVLIDGSNYSEEIAKCRTVLIPMYANVGSQSQVYAGIRGYSGARSVMVQIPDLLKMEDTPALEYDNLQGAIIDREGTSRNITAIALNGKFGVTFTVDGDLATGTQAVYFNRIVYITSE